MRVFSRLFLQPPWNIAIFFALYAVFFMLLVQDTFAVSVVGQVCMGTLFVSVKLVTPLLTSRLIQYPTDRYGYRCTARCFRLR